MKSSDKIGVVAAATTTVAIACFVLSLLSAGVGHGSYLPFPISFPYAFLSVELFGGDIGLIAGTLMFAQFLIYGIVVSRAWLADRLSKGAAAVMLTHGVIASVCIVIFYAS